MDSLSKKILVIGSGFLGSNVANEFMSLDNTVTTTNLTNVQKGSRVLDITDNTAVKKCFNEIKPDIVINCAGSTDIDFLEKNPQLAYSINGHGVKNLASASEEFNSRFIQISTDGVFDGIKGNYTEYDTPSPVNTYARSKMIGEEEAAKNCQDHVVIRTNFYGIHQNGRFLFSSILSKLQNGIPIVGFDDVIFTPLEVSNLAELIADIAFSNHVGVLNLSSNESITKYEFCFHTANTLGFKPSLVKKGSIDEIEFIAKRPKNTSLINTKSKQFTKHKIISFMDWLLEIKEPAK